MGIDTSRFTFDPNKRYSSVRQQQGRVSLDSDWNEQVDIAAYRIETEATDLIGPSGVPRDSAGFQIQGPSLAWTPNTAFALGTQIVDSNGAVEIAMSAGTSGATQPTWPATVGATVTDGAGLTWQRAVTDFAIAPGRIYVDGRMCELAATPLAIENFTGDGTGAPGTQVQVATTVVDGLPLEIGQWVQISAEGNSAPAPMSVQITNVDAAAGSLTLSPAVSSFGSPNTNPQLQRVTTYLTQADYPAAAPLPEPPTGTRIVYLDVWERPVTALEDPQLLEVALGGPDTTTRTKTVWQVKLVDVTKVAGVACSTPASSIAPWEAVTRAPGGQLTNGVVPSASAGPCSLTSNTGYTGLENQFYRVEIHQGGTAMPSGSAMPVTSIPSGVASFKWSRDNGSVATAVLGIAKVTNNAGNPASQLTVQSLGRDQVLGFAPGNWVEITDDWLELSGQHGELHQIVSIDVTATTITLDSPVTSPAFPTTGGQTDPARHTRLTRWDQSRKVFLSDGATVWVDLGAAGATGDIPVPPAGTTLILESGITVSFNLDAPDSTFHSADYWNFTARTANGSVEPLVQAYPRGVQHHFSRLGIINFDARPWSFQDCRRVFAPLADSVVHVSALSLAGVGRLFGDSTVTVQELANGVNVVCDGPLDPASISRPTCFVTVELPAVSAGATMGFNPVVLASNVTLDTTLTTIIWTPTSDAQAALLAQISPTGPPVLAHLTLKGNFIWSLGNPEVRLDGDSFGTPYQDSGGTQHTGLQLPSGDGRRGGDFEMWFWLTSVPAVTLSATNLGFGQQLVGTPSAPQTVALTNNTSSQLTITVSAAGDFAETDTCGGSVAANSSCTISVSFTPTITGTRTGQISINAGQPTPFVIQLTGTGIAPAITSSPTGLAFGPQTVGTGSAPLAVTITNSGTAPLTISGVTTSGDFSQTTNCTVLTAGASCSIQVQFSPQTTGFRPGSLTINHNAVGSPLVLPLTGTGVKQKETKDIKDKDKDKEFLKEKDKEKDKDVREKLREVIAKAATIENAPLTPRNAPRVAENEPGGAAPSGGTRTAFIRPDERPPVGQKVLRKAGAKKSR